MARFDVLSKVNFRHTPGFFSDGYRPYTPREYSEDFCLLRKVPNRTCNIFANVLSQRQYEHRRLYARRNGLKLCRVLSNKRILGFIEWLRQQSSDDLEPQLAAQDAGGIAHEEHTLKAEPVEALRRYAFDLFARL